METISEEQIARIEERRRENLKKCLKNRIGRLSDKIIYRTEEIRKFGPKKFMRKLKTVYLERSGMVRHWHRMAEISLRQTRKKLYKLKNQLDSL